MIIILEALILLASPGLAAWIIVRAMQTMGVEFMAEYSPQAVAIDCAETVTAFWWLLLVLFFAAVVIHDRYAQGRGK